MLLIIPGSARATAAGHGRTFRRRRGPSASFFYIVPFFTLRRVPTGRADGRVARSGGVPRRDRPDATLGIRRSPSANIVTACIVMAGIFMAGI